MINTSFKSNTKFNIYRYNFDVHIYIKMYLVLFNKIIFSYLVSSVTNFLLKPYTYLNLLTIKNKNF